MTPTFSIVPFVQSCAPESGDRLLAIVAHPHLKLLHRAEQRGFHDTAAHGPVLAQEMTAPALMR